MEKEKKYLGLSRGEGLIIILLMLFISILAIVQTVRGREAPYKQFIERAGLIGQALEAFAKDHGGRYPDDGQNSQSPPGLSPNYIQWEEEWNIDYEVHDNGRGGTYVALEYMGRYQPNRPFNSQGLTRDPLNRKIYGQGQLIPRKTNRIWVFWEAAPIYYRK
jgi:hypothetical protein